MSITAGQGLAVSAVFEVTQHHQGAPGIGHGGVLAAAFDEALGATNWLLRSTAVTAHLEISYRAPVPIGSAVYIVARIDAVRGRKIWASAEGRLDHFDGPLAVTAASLYLQVPVEHFTRHGRTAEVAAAGNQVEVAHHLASLDIAP
jgi:acyl-coenzyme A thioesterase PaaI-like protein